jgi:hypothetical protein
VVEGNDVGGDGKPIETLCLQVPKKGTSRSYPYIHSKSPARDISHSAQNLCKAPVSSRPVSCNSTKFSRVVSPHTKSQTVASAQARSRRILAIVREDLTPTLRIFAAMLDIKGSAVWTTVRHFVDCPPPPVSQIHHFHNHISQQSFYPQFSSWLRLRPLPCPRAKHAPISITSVSNGSSP